ncbi:division/cell wall cluster transcriptional repressor MraZ [Thiospirochaeta perfilievii]|uniref:Transcriptional regulator MraZ n=1 Tax=Thiospirochaeta perfilievii TaxID=252967 RepID=A0A5C1Q8D8_9SPIO|nr:division/cell wall cluster transcriptional repressor MraZ [Thiospirochaeta perfilievii]QEN03751.1 division/cell wall cluster transcriptional repressor MraZ [Thiospirochaeta perfilievii]
MGYEIKGQFNGTIDDKGRLLLPGKIRASLPDDILVQTRGVDRCIWLFPTEPWQKLEALVKENSSLFKSQSRLIQRRLIAPAQEVNIDKAGRIKLSASVMKSVDVVRECVILGLDDHIEVWDVEAYEEYQRETEEDLNEALEGLDF